MAKKKAAVKTLLPDEIRCRRSDGRGWRCSRRIVDGMTLCDVHYDQRRRHELKQKVPDHLKLQKKSKKGLPELRKKSGVAQTRKMGLPEIAEKAVRAAKLKRGSKNLGLLRDYLKMVLEAKKKKDDDGMEPTTLKLPAGEMTISKRNPDSATRTFRSKKIEPSIFRALD